MPPSKCRATFVRQSHQGLLARQRLSFCGYLLILRISSIVRLIVVSDGSVIDEGTEVMATVNVFLLRHNQKGSGIRLSLLVDLSERGQ